MATREKPTPTTRNNEARNDSASDEHDLSTLQERHPDWPAIKLSFYFAPHGNYEDMKGLEPHIRESDIFLYEDVRRNPGKEQAFNFISSRTSQPVESIIDASATANGSTRGTHVEAIVRGLHDSQTVAASIDIGRDDYETMLADDIMHSLQRFMPKGMDYEDSLKYMRLNSAHIAESMNEREDTMTGNFEQEIARILESHPELKDKEDLKVLISMGSYHTRLRHQFARLGMRSENHFSTESPYVYGYGHELMRSYAFGKEPSDELVGRALAEGIVRRAIQTRKGDKLVSSDEKTAYLRRYVSVLTKEEVSSLLDLWNNDQATADNIDALLVPAEMPALPRTTAELLRKNQEFKEHAQTLGGAAITH